MRDKLVSLAIREFALPVPRTGSIDVHSGYGRAKADGQEIHLRVQARRAAAFTAYKAEVSVSHELERGGYTFAIAGRMDGIFDNASPLKPKIEEIKSSFSAKDLLRRLNHAGPEHPYMLQLRTYGYIHWLQHGVEPDLSFHLVSTRNYESEDLEIPLDLAGYERWLDLRLDELVIEAEKSEARANRRRKVAAAFSFPFDNPRRGQVELVASVADAMKHDTRILVQAPTGLGKTVGVLYPALQDALGRGQNVVYVTPKNSQHAVAEDAATKFRDTGSKVKSLTITAKSKICFKAEPICNPDYCEYAKDHYTKVAAGNVIDKLNKKRKLDGRAFRKIAEEHQVCPFEIQLDAAKDAEIVVCDYNYVFAPRTSFGRISTVSVGQEGKPNLVIDEAHNLPARAMDYYSPELSSSVLDRMREEIRELPKRFMADAEILLDECIQVIKDAGDSHPDGQSKRQKIKPQTGPFEEHDAKLKSFMSRYLESDVEIQPRDVVMRLCFYWSEFTSSLELASDPSREEFFTTYEPHHTGGKIRIVCCDASKMLKECYDDYGQVVGFSATLKPFDFYAKLSGLDPAKIRTEEFSSPFAKSNRKLLIIPQISTKWSDRERNYPKIAEAIERMAALKRGNYFAFFPSFDFLERVAQLFVPPEGFAMLRQSRDMKAADIEAVMDDLRSQARPTVMFAVQGGVFSEGVDYPGDMIIGAFVVGPPLPSFDLEREQMREYYQKHYGSGFDYAYAYPAMAKAVQAAGRVIRSETDRGLIVLMDGRFVQNTYSQSMPADWFETGPRELVSSSILKEISDFWASGPIAENPVQTGVSLDSPACLGNSS